MCFGFEGEFVNVCERFFENSFVYVGEESVVRGVGESLLDCLSISFVVFFNDEVVGKWNIGD